MTGNANEAAIQSSELFDVSDCVAVVAGGGSGMGLQIAKALEANGAKVYILDRQPEALEAAAKQSTYANICPLRCDITSRDDLQKAVDYIANEDGFVNLVVNDPGISTPTLVQQRDRPTPKWNITDLRNFWFNGKPGFEEYARVFEANTTAPLMVTFAFLELLDNGNKARAEQAQAEGCKDFVRSQVVITSSVGAFGRDNSTFIYGASRAGSTQMGKNLATYLVPWKIRVNVLAPGYFHTDMTDGFYKSTRGRLPATMVPEERFGNAEEIGGTVLYLASKAGAYCNGSVMLADGGYLGAHSSTY